MACCEELDEGGHVLREIFEALDVHLAALGAALSPHIVNGNGKPLALQHARKFLVPAAVLPVPVQNEKQLLRPRIPKEPVIKLGAVKGGKRSFVLGGHNGNGPGVGMGDTDLSCALKFFELKTVLFYH